MLQTFNQLTIDTVWEKGQIVPNHNSNVWRKDTCSVWIKKSAYGEIDSDHGWEIVISDN